MRQAQARKISDAYLDAPRRSDRHLHVVEDAPVQALEEPRPRLLEEPSARVVSDLSALIDVPDWAEPFADPRWDDRLGSSNYEERDGRRTVLVTGRPEGKAVPRRVSTEGPTARQRRHTPTRARLAGRPDRVALWAVALGLIMAAMAGFTGGGHGHSSHGPDLPAPAPLSSR